MAGKSKTPLVNEFQKWLADNRDDGKDYFKAVYLTPRDEAIPSEYIGDDVTDDIRSMFNRVLDFISDRLMKQKKTVSEFAVPMVDASWEDSTGYALMYKGRVLYRNYMKAWHFYFESKKDFEEFLQGIWDDCIKALEQAVDDEDLYLFSFVVRQGEYEHSYTHTLRAKSEAEALKKAKAYLRDFYGEDNVEVEEGGMAYHYNGGDMIGEMGRVEKINLKKLLDYLTVES